MNRRLFLGMSATLAAATLFPKPLLAASAKFVGLPQGRIAYAERGRGPTALFLHGFPLSSFQWRGAIDRLSDHRRCLAPDWMGLGQTEVAPGQSVTPAAQAEMLAAFLDKLKAGPVDIVANDSGGAVAQLFLATYPERVRSLLLTNCDVETDSPPAALLPILDLAKVDLYCDLYLEPWLTHKEEARSQNGLGGMCYSNPANPTDEALERYLGPLLATEERKTLVNRYAMGLSPNPLAGIAEKLRASRQPTRIVWGMADSIFSPKSPDYLAGLITQASIRRLDKAKLFWPEEYPDIIAEEAKKLWRLS